MLNVYVVLSILAVNSVNGGILVEFVTVSAVVTVRFTIAEDAVLDRG